MHLRVIQIFSKLPVTAIFSFDYQLLRRRNTLEGATLVTCALSDMWEIRTQRKVLSKRARIEILALIQSRADYWKPTPWVGKPVLSSIFSLILKQAALSIQCFLLREHGVFVLFTPRISSSTIPIICLLVRQSLHFWKDVIGSVSWIELRFPVFLIGHWCH